MPASKICSKQSQISEGRLITTPHGPKHTQLDFWLRRPERGPHRNHWEQAARFLADLSGSLDSDRQTDQDKSQGRRPGRAEPDRR